MTRRRWAVLIVAAWTALALIWLTPRALRWLIWGEPFEPVFVWVQLAYAWLWAALTPAVVWLCRRLPLHEGRWRSSLPLQLVASLGVALLDRAFITGLDGVLHQVRWIPPVPVSFAERFVRLLSYDVGLRMIIYLQVAGIAYAFLYHGIARARALQAAELEERLLSTELHLLKVQLQPRFLFETLRATRARATRDPKSADRMISRLSDLLRLTLDHSGRQEVALKEELEFVAAYLRVQDSLLPRPLDVRLEIAPDALDARVPNLILQPLLESAVRREPGAARAAGRIDVVAQRRNGTLRLEVRQDAPGAPGRDAETDELRTTRERLRQLYGGEHRFDVGEQPGGGSRVSLEIPFREDPQTGGDANGP